MVWVAAMAWAADPPPAQVVPEPVSELRARVEALEQQVAEAGTARAADQAELARLRAQLDEGAILLDERNPAEDRAAAATRLGDSGDASAMWLLRAGAGAVDPEVRLACARAAIHLSPPDGAEVARRVLEARDAARPTRLAVVDLLADPPTEAAARVLYDVSGEASVPASVRAHAVDVLRERYADRLPTLGPTPGVVDPLGGVALVAANGLAGGILLSSVGQFGSFDGSVAIGAVGGGAIGIGSGALYAASQPLTLGEGLSYASGVSLGLTYGLWTTTAVEGAWKWIPYRERPAVAEPAAVFRALGVAVGGVAGGYASTRGPSSWDVLEVDTSTYLGSEIVLGATALATYHPPGGPTYSTYTTYGTPNPSEYVLYRRRASQWLAGSELVGATAGLAVGVALAPRWDLDPQDGAFAVVAGTELAWVGYSLPTALGVDASELKGNVRLPWNAGIAAGLAFSELHPVSLRRTAGTAWGALVGNALGAGVPSVANADVTAVDGVMAATGLAGSVGAYLADPLVAPDGGDAAMIGVGTTVGTVEGALVGAYLARRDAFADPSQQSAGLAELGFGVVGAGLYALSPAVDPAADDMVLLGTAAAWGGWYGVLLPVAAGSDGLELPAAVGIAAGTGVGGLALTRPIGLRPGRTVLPQLLALSGGTVGALGAALASPRSQDVATGALIGSTAGFVGGAALELATAPKLQLSARLRIPGVWAPLIAVAPDSGTAVVGLRGAHL